MEVCHTSQIIHKNLLFRATSWMPFVSNRYSTIEIIRLSCEIYSTYWMKMNLEWRCDMWCCTIHIEFNAKHWMVHCLVFFHRSQIQKVNRKSICVCVCMRARTHTSTVLTLHLEFYWKWLFVWIIKAGIRVYILVLHLHE